jgi:hypothetical protein
LDVPRLLQHVGQPLEGGHLLGRLGPQDPLHQPRVDAGARGALLEAAQLPLHLLHLLEALDDVQGVGEVQGLLAQEGVFPKEGGDGEEVLQEGGEAGHLRGQLLVLEGLPQEVLQLAALLRGEALQEGGHGGRLALEALRQLLEGAGTVGAQEVPPPLEEPLEVGLPPLAALLQEAVQVLQELLEGLQVLGAQAPEPLQQVPEGAPEDPAPGGSGGGAQSAPWLRGW